MKKIGYGAAAFALLIAVCGVLFMFLPSSFLPDEDQGTLYVDVQLPPGATIERTKKVVEEIDTYFRTVEKDSIQSVMSVIGWGFSSTGQNSAMVMPLLRDWSERGKGQSSFDIMERASARFASIPDASVFVMIPPAMMELGTSSGFEMQLTDRAGQGHEALFKARDMLLGKAKEAASVTDARYSGMEDTEQYDLSIDIAKAGAYGLTKGDINGAISAYWAGEDINNFSDHGRTKKVYFQADPAFRTNINDFSKYYIRNSHDEMVPLSSVVKAQSIVASPSLTRYRGSPSVKIEGSASQGKSSGQAMREWSSAHPACRPVLTLHGQDSRIRNRPLPIRPPCCTPYPSFLFFSASPRCTKAGRFHWLSCLPCPPAS